MANQIKHEIKKNPAIEDGWLHKHLPSKTVTGKENRHNTKDHRTFAASLFKRQHSPMEKKDKKDAL